LAAGFRSGFQHADLLCLPKPVGISCCLASAIEVNPARNLSSVISGPHTDPDPQRFSLNHEALVFFPDRTWQTIGSRDAGLAELVLRDTANDVQRTRKKNRRKAAILGVLARARGPLSYAQVAGAMGIYPISQGLADLRTYRIGYALGP